jgi:hypothetical protein
LILLRCAIVSYCFPMHLLVRFAASSVSAACCFIASYSALHNDSSRSSGANGFVCGRSIKVTATATAIIATTMSMRGFIAALQQLCVRALSARGPGLAGTNPGDLAVVTGTASIRGRAAQLLVNWAGLRLIPPGVGIAGLSRAGTGFAALH